MDWTVAANLGTAAGTLVLAVATFASVRSANRAARVAQQSLLEAIRPLLLPSRLQDAEVKVGFVDDVWMHLPGGRGRAEVGDDAVYLAISLRNAGTGLAVLHGWQVYPERLTGDVERPDASQFRRLTRDLYVPVGDVGFWQGALRDPQDAVYAPVEKAIRSDQPLTVDVLYSDADGGQRVVTRIALQPTSSGDGTWLASVDRHWNLDRPDPR